MTAYIKAAAQYVPTGMGGKLSKSGQNAPSILGLGAAIRTSLVGATVSPSSTTLVIPYINGFYNTVVKALLNGVTTLAGSGSLAFADGTGTAASFNQPYGVAVIPSSGVIVVADTGNSRIRLVTPLGVVTTLAGSGNGAFADGSGAAASFTFPAGVAVIPSSGVIVVADALNNRIRLIA